MTSKRRLYLVRAVLSFLTAVMHVVWFFVFQVKDDETLLKTTFLSGALIGFILFLIAIVQYILTYKECDRVSSPIQR